MASKNIDTLTEGTQSETLTNVKVTKSKSGSTTPRKVDPLWSVIRKAHKVFAVQIKKDNETKLHCLEFAMHSKFDDHEKFWVEYHKHTSTLLDSRRFCNDCLSKKYEPAVVAEHIVFEGHKMIKRVLKEGVINVLGESIRLYDKRFTPDDTARFVTEENDCVVNDVAKMLEEQESQTQTSGQTPQQPTKQQTGNSATPQQTPKAEEQQTPEQTPQAA
jgi:hypothetical protein